mmetsp:Transcript_100333/g.289690  ORF Transcript_100333/g.289690 Transcript_100333/m.289690 type:complete len:230 (-) Transcript_100333:809-1498(-)
MARSLPLMATRPRASTAPPRTKEFPSSKHCAAASMARSSPDSATMVSARRAASLTKKSWCSKRHNTRPIAYWLPLRATLDSPSTATSRTSNRTCSKRELTSSMRWWLSWSAACNNMVTALSRTKSLTWSMHAAIFFKIRASPTADNCRSACTAEVRTGSSVLAKCFEISCRAYSLPTNASALPVSASIVHGRAERRPSMESPPSLDAHASLIVGPITHMPPDGVVNQCK